MARAHQPNKNPQERQYEAPVGNGTCNALATDAVPPSSHFADYARDMVTEKMAMIRHLDGSTTVWHVAGKSAVFGLDVTDCWVVTPPDGFAPQPGDELVTNLLEGQYEYAVPIADVLPALKVPREI